MRRNAATITLCVSEEGMNSPGFPGGLSHHPSSFPGRIKVVLVRWNEPFQKLATCDTDGGIFVWIQYEGRWSVELVNDRGAQVKIRHQLLLGIV